MSTFMSCWSLIIPREVIFCLVHALSIERPLWIAEGAFLVFSDLHRFTHVSIFMYKV